MEDASKRLEERFVELGEGLADSPPSSVEELYSRLDLIDGLLSSVEQSPSKIMLNALQPLMKALAVKDFLSHSDIDVKVVVASCISEITRITAPEAPYDDDIMKEIFKLIVGAFQRLDDMSSRSFKKRVSILETVAKVRSCVMMLDLECDALILDMFQHFLKTIRNDHSETVFSCMETVMTLVIEESEDVSTKLLSVLLDTLKIDNKDALPRAQRLAEKVTSNCAKKIKPYVVELVQSTGAPLSKYNRVVASIYQEDTDALDQNGTHVCGEVVAGDINLSERTSSDKLPQVPAKMEQQANSPEKVDTAKETSTIAAMSNGTVQVENSDSIKKPPSPKQESESSRLNGQSKNVISDHGDCDNLEPVAVKPVAVTDLKEEEGQKTSPSVLFTDTTDHIQADSDKDAPAGTQVANASEKEAEPAVSLEPETKNELRHVSGSDDLNSVASPTAIEILPNSATHIDVDAVAGRPAAPSLDEDPTGNSDAHDEEMPSKSNESKKVAETVENVEAPASLADNSAVESKTTGKKKGRNKRKVADLPASASGQTDPSGKNQTHDEVMPSKGDESKNKLEDAEAPLSLASDSATKSKTSSKTTRFKLKVPGPPTSACRNSHTHDESMLSKQDESKDTEVTEDVEAPADLASDSAAKSRALGKKGLSKREVDDTPASASEQKDRLGNSHAHDEAMPSKGDESKGTEDAEAPARLANESAVKSRTKGRKGRFKRKVTIPPASASEQKDPTSASEQKDPSENFHTHDESIPSKEDESKEDTEDADDVEAPAVLASNSAVKARTSSKKGRFKRKSRNSRTHDEAMPLEMDEPKKETKDADVEGSAILASDSAVKSRTARKKGQNKRKFSEEESSTRKKSNSKKLKEEGTPGKDVVSEPSLKEMVSSFRSASKARSADRTHTNDGVNPKSRRKRAMETQDIQETPGTKKGLGESIVGSKIEVWWPMDEMFYDGIVDSYDPGTKKHKILYTDGEVETLFLNKEQWKYAESDLGIEEDKKKAEGNNASQKSRTKKSKTRSNTTAKEAKSQAESKRSSHSDPELPKSRGRPKTSSLGKLSYDDSPGTSKKSKGKSPNVDNAKTETPKTITKLKVYSSKAKRKSENDTAKPKDSTPKILTKSEVGEASKSKTPKTRTKTIGDLKENNTSSKGKTKVGESEDTTVAAEAATGLKKRKSRK